MIDLALLRDAPDLVKASQEARGESADTVDAALAADRDRRAAITAFEELRAEQNAHGKKVAKAPKDEKAALVAEAKDLSERVKAAQQAATAAEEAAADALALIENIVIDGVPAGGEDDFITLRTHGEIPTFDFTPRDHLELGEKLGAIDMERGTKVSGSRFYFLTGIGARLELALMSLALDRALQAGFTPMIPPTLVRPEVMRGTGFLGKHAAEVYHLEEQDLYLVGTSEVPLAGYHMGEILDLTAGVHQFNKLEMFVYADPADAEAEHLRLVEMQERMLQDLGLAYRVIDVAAGDLGSSAARKYDVEAWVPTQDAYRELTSTSNCTTYQARRLDVRHRPDGGKTSPVATLNGTLGTTRWIVAILETHQREDGSVTVPEVLRPYLGGLEVMEPIA
ncbi:MAG: seryl-tRNA synthetase [Agromyces sp.]|nr:seryl-tRNA synthetase [Agromyces sp.]